MQASHESAPGTASAAPGQAGRRALLLVIVAAAALALYQYASLFPFIIDDAYIVLHYARNLVTRGELAFNPGEHVSALTSPLHALITAALYALVGEGTLLANKILSCACIAVGAWVTLRPHPDRAGGVAVTLVMLIAAPSVALWTFGGLETPLLFLVVALFSAKVVGGLHDRQPFTRGAIVELHLLAAAAFLLRHDSVCFFAPALLVAWRHRPQWPSIALGVALAAIPCVAWFAFAWSYYGDLLPTSFYVKTPGFRLHGLLATGLYEILWLTLMGFLPVFVVALVARSRRGDWSIDRRELILLAGLGVVAAYGLTMAQKHMMFGFRAGMPYLPAATAVVLLELRHWSVRPASLATILLAILIADAVHTQRMLDVSVNGYWKWSEYSEADAHSLIRMVDVWKGSADDIRAHWRAQGKPGNPRVFTYAGGVMPYEIPEAYIYEELISARRMHCFSVEDIPRAPDYVHAMSTPKTRGTQYYNMIAGDPGLELISDRPIEVGGELRHVQIFYNAQPHPVQMPARFNDPCPQPVAGAQRSYFYQWARQVQGPDPLDKMSHRELRDIHAKLEFAPRPFLAGLRGPAGAAAGVRLHRPEHGRHDLPDPGADPGHDHLGLAVPEGSDQGRLLPHQADDLPVARGRARDEQRRRLSSASPADRVPPLAAGAGIRAGAPA